MGDPDIAHAARPLPLEERTRMRLDIGEVVYLHEVHALDAHPAQRLLHLPGALVAPVRPYLGGEKQLLADSELGGEIAHDGFARAVHRRAVDHACTATGEERQHLAQRRARRRILTDIEGLPGSEADDRQALAACGDRPSDELCAWLRTRPAHRACRRRHGDEAQGSPAT